MTIWGSEMSQPSFGWGPECGDGIAVGLAVPHTEVAADHPFRWRWAIRTSDEAPREVTIRDDFDPVFRYRLQVRRAGVAEPLAEFPPRPTTSRTTSPRSPITVALLKGTPQEIDGGEAGIDHSWGPGVYDLQVLYGGPGFTFACHSAVVSVQVR
jgi:hypothetical protein